MKKNLHKAFVVPLTDIHVEYNVISSCTMHLLKPFMLRIRSIVDKIMFVNYDIIEKTLCMHVCLLKDSWEM